MLDNYALRKNIIVYGKDEGSNLNNLTTTLKSIVNCDMLGLEENFQGACFGHAFSKACLYVTTKEKNCKNLSYVSIKFVQGDLKKCITWPKNLKRVKTCVNSNIPPQKLNTPMKTK